MSVPPECIEQALSGRCAVCDAAEQEAMDRAARRRLHRALIAATVALILLVVTIGLVVTSPGGAL